MESWSDIKNSLNTKEYIKFLQENGEKIFYIDDFPWMKYQYCLQPAILPGPYVPPEFDSLQIKKLLKETGVPFVRWPGEITPYKTEWYWIICRPPFSIDLLSHKSRNQTKKALANCTVKLITPQELIKIGYDCYLASCRISKKIFFLNQTEWENFINSHIKYHCFDFWGVFIDNKLVGYAKCLKIDKRINLSSLWYNPNYIKYYPIYALIYTLLDYYLNQQQCCYVTNGMRSIAHNTQMQEFLEIKFNFKKEYCKLNVIYSPVFEIFVKIIYPFRCLFKIIYQLIPINFLKKINILINQEKIRRSFL